MGVVFKLNGKNVVSHFPKEATLLKVLREEFFLTGTKDGCAKGDCGACMVLINNVAHNSCLTLLGEIENKEIITIEGLMSDSVMDPVQSAFAESGALQCGYCTPGMIIAAKSLLNHSPMPNREEIKKAISGNLCRCTGYEQIIEAVELAAKKMEKK